MDAWASILRLVEGSRLLLKHAAFEASQVRRNYLGFFAERGVKGDRLEIRGGSAALREHLAAYAEVDVALDTVPYNGLATTCEALWMGVPMVAIAEERMISRQTAAMLRVVGLPQFIAENRDDYVALAVRRAQEREELAAIRASLRGQMRASALCDGSRFTRDLETALRTAWRHYSK
jgi:predicted O-linked N-acetylglucosamine transferase (SPINDLY family)